jgi:hypothetical protein
VDSTTVAQIAPIVRANIAKETTLMTDVARQYLEVGGEFASHESVNHGAKRNTLRSRPYHVPSKRLDQEK